MAVNFDAATPMSAWSATDPFTWSHTVGSGSNRLLLVFLCSQHYSDAGPTMFNTVTFGGVSMTEYACTPQDTGRGVSTDIYYLKAPASGSGTISVGNSWNAYGAWGCAISFDGVDQTTPLGTPVTGAPYDTAGANETVTISSIASAVGDIVVGGFASLSNNPGSYGSGAGQTNRGLKTDFAINNNFVGMVDTIAGAASVTMTFTTDANSGWYRASNGVSVKAAAGGGGATYSGLLIKNLGMSQAVARSVVR